MRKKQSRSSEGKETQTETIDRTIDDTSNPLDIKEIISGGYEGPYPCLKKRTLQKHKPNDNEWLYMTRISEDWEFNE